MIDSLKKNDGEIFPNPWKSKKKEVRTASSERLHESTPSKVRLTQYENGVGVDVRIGDDWYAVNLGIISSLSPIDNPDL